jgi:ribose transport system permease protein
VSPRRLLPRWPPELTNGIDMHGRHILYLLLREAGIGLALLLLALIFSVTAPHFASMDNLTNIPTQISINTVIAVGMTFVILLGGIDLSVGSVLALATIVGGMIITQEQLSPGAAIALAVVASTGVGCACGFVNGWVSERWKMHSFVVTLGMLNVARGTADQRLAHDLLALEPVLVGRFVLARTIFAIGNNEEAVRLSGHNPSVYKTAAYTVCGGMVGLAAVMYMMRLNIASPILGVGFELNAIAAVVIGGNSMSGGKGSMIGTFLGASIMGVLNDGLLLLGMGDFARQMMTGLIIVVAVIIDQYRARALARVTLEPVHAAPEAVAPRTAT